MSKITPALVIACRELEKAMKGTLDGTKLQEIQDTINGFAIAYINEVHIIILRNTTVLSGTVLSQTVSIKSVSNNTGNERRNRR